MHAEAAVEAGAGEADEGAEFGGGPLWGGGGAVDAGFVGGEGLKFEELKGRRVGLADLRRRKGWRGGEGAGNEEWAWAPMM